MAQTRPHLVMFIPDQWRGDVLGHLGNPAAVTPNIDRLVETEAVSFRHAFCQSPLCTPSRCSFMTGWYPHVRGHRSMSFGLEPGDPMLLQILKRQGYHVWWGGKNDLVAASDSGQYCDDRFFPRKVWPQKPWQTMYAYDKQENWRGPADGDDYYSFFAGKLPTTPDTGCYLDDDWGCVQGAIEAIQHRPIDKPLCIFLALNYPHPPYAVEDPWFSMIERDKLPPRRPRPDGWQGKPSMMKGLWEGQRLQAKNDLWWNELRATYYGMCARVDHQLGMVIEALREADIFDQTAVMFFSDHGDYAGDYDLPEKNMNTFEDPLVNVPLIVKPPVSIEATPGVRDALVELVDLPATIADLTGVELDHIHFGRSIVEALRGQNDHHRDAVFAEGGRIHGEWMCMELESTWDHPSENPYWPRHQLQRSEGPQHTKATMCRTKQYKYIRRLYEQDELYDLTKDPQEVRNVINDSAYDQVLLQLKERMLTFLHSTTDVVSPVYTERDPAPIDTAEESM